MSKPMRMCPDCGAWLDSGERCDCKDANANDPNQEAGAEAAQQATPNPHGPVLAVGA